MNDISASVEQMTQGHLRNIQQLAVFFTGCNNVFAINIAKVKAFIITDEITISKTPSETPIIAGIATIRGEPITLINLDVWIGSKPLKLKEYRLVIYCEFSHKKVGFLIKDMINIVEKTTKELRPSETSCSKITYTTYVDINNKDELCTVFNAEQLLQDIGWGDNINESMDKYVPNKIDSIKIVLVAEDSNIAREFLIKFFQKVELKYELYRNGEELLDRVKEIDMSTVGIIITDIEMPKVDGFQVSRYIKNKYPSIPIIVNSSMTTNAIKDKMNSIGVDSFVGKTNTEILYNEVSRLMKI